ncbi:beta-eliminating lyase-related protein [Aneurinibacillus tyrosinisolvens]|uniref:beta-eliminating lyase-related protein n=1 Tax=Aneurinibacillus tyrosinisolvens TaxID=1443435 RepID=UPI001F3BB190|nr:beta-eliminating lyase-related protein [Aneurinibacillus tyrosinisolvens]
MRAAIRLPDESLHTSLLCIENTQNRAGGTIVPLENMKAFSYLNLAWAYSGSLRTKIFQRTISIKH